MKFTRTLLYITLLSSCGGLLSKQDYLDWFKTQGMYVSIIEQDGYFFEATFTPKELLMIREWGEDLTDSLYKCHKHEYDSIRYFSLKIGASDQSSNALKYNINTSNDYYKRLEYFAHKAQLNFYMEHNNQHVQCKIYHFERYYNTSPYDIILLGFPRFSEIDLTQKIYLKFYDAVLGVGALSFDYSPTIMNNSSELKLN